MTDKEIYTPADILLRIKIYQESYSLKMMSHEIALKNLQSEFESEFIKNRNKE